MRFKVEVKKSKIDGNGLFACEPIPAKRKLGEMSGEIVSLKQANDIAKNKKRIAIVELNDKVALYANAKKNEFCFINHSCTPNAYMRVQNLRVEFYSLKNIKTREEITCNYGETHHEGTLKCRCGSPLCKGRI